MGSAEVWVVQQDLQYFKTCSKIVEMGKRLANLKKEGSSFQNL